MTTADMRRQVAKAIDPELLEEALTVVVANNIDYMALAKEIWDTWEDEFINQAAQVITEDLFPF